MRTLFVDLDGVLGAMATPSARFFLDTRSGHVEVALDPADAEDADHVLIPPQAHPSGGDLQALVPQALAWLRGLGIEPQYELRARKAAPPSVGLVEMLLLGAPDGKTELIGGRVRRVLLADSAEVADQVFARLTREIAAHHERDRFHLAVDGRCVELRVKLSPAAWAIFSAGA